MLLFAVSLLINIKNWSDQSRGQKRKGNGSTKNLKYVLPTDHLLTRVALRPQQPLAAEWGQGGSRRVNTFVLTLAHRHCPPKTIKYEDG